MKHKKHAHQLAKELKIKLSNALEIIAYQKGYKTWNLLLKKEQEVHTDETKVTDLQTANKNIQNVERRKNGRLH